MSKPVIFDEIQLAPELFLPLKAAVDRSRQPGAFLLTGSANVLTLPKIADSLAGRMELLTLRPLSQGEIEGRKENFIKAIFADDFKPTNFETNESREELFGGILAGGFPEALERKTEARRQDWFKSYIATLLQRDVRDLANIEGLRDLPRLFSVLAARRRASQLCQNFPQFGTRSNNAQAQRSAARSCLFNRAASGVVGEFDETLNENAETFFSPMPDC